jgi:hypothetical protein
MEKRGTQAGGKPRRFVALAVLGLLASWAAVIFVSYALRAPVVEQYAYLADALLHGHISVDNLPATIADQVAYGGHTYLPFGPFPALVAMPFFLLFGYSLHTMVITWPLTVLNGLLLWRIFGHLGLAAVVRGWLLALFGVGSVYSFVMINEGAWFLAQVVTVGLLLAAVWLVVRKSVASISRWEWLAVGLLLGAALLTRSTAAFAALFFVTLIVATARLEGWSRRAWVAPLAMLGLGLGVGLALYFAYNYARFGSVTETGYAMAKLTSEQLREQMAIGLFSVQHVPLNFYYMFLKGFDPWPSASAAALQFPWFVPSPLGMSILLTTPALVYTLRPRLSNPFALACWMAIIPTMLALLCYYAPGQIQFGYRYTLDFMPFAMLLLALAFKDGISRVARALIVVGIIVCVWGNATIGLVWYD